MNGPKNIKYRKVYGPTVVYAKEEHKYINPVFGIYYLKFIETGIIDSKQLEGARKTLKKLLKKRGILWTAIFTDRSVSSKPTEVRMGKGKGAHSEWVAVVKAGKILFELGGISHKEVKEILLVVKKKISLKTELGKLKI